MAETILHTIHGSRLYGTSLSSKSDYDTYRVVQGPKRYLKHTIQGDQDVTVVSWDTFLEQCGRGVPQALEAMFSPLSEVDDRYQSFVYSYRIGRQEVLDRYRRTILNFAYHSGKKGYPTLKRKRHAYRLCFNLNSIVCWGRFNPQLSSQQVRQTMEYALVPYHEHIQQTHILLGEALLGNLEEV